MNPWEFWSAIIALVVATWIARSGFMVLGNRVSLPPRVQSALRFAPACALAALIAPDVLMSDGHIISTALNSKLIASLAAVGFFMLRKDMLQTICFGMLVLTGFRLLGLSA
jgi:branched-subunit amino acid transport protein